MADRKQLFVTDACVLLKWIVRDAEEDVSNAIALREDILKEHVDVIVPTHCFSEVCNMLGLKRHSEALSFLSFLLNAGIEEYGLTLDIGNTAFKFMEQYKGVTFYDAAYHALAIQEGGIFITADEKYHNMTRKEGSIMLLKDYGKKR